MSANPDVTVDTKARQADIQPMTTTGASSEPASDRSRGVTLALAAILGPFGGHRFYVDKPGTGALMALTLGGLGIWWVYDLILVASGSFRDAEGRLVRRWDPEETAAAGVTPAEVLDELDALRQQVSELAERVDFSERLLARPQDRSRPPLPS